MTAAAAVVVDDDAVVVANADAGHLNRCDFQIFLVHGSAFPRSLFLGEREDGERSRRYHPY